MWLPVTFEMFLTHFLKIIPPCAQWANSGHMGLFWVSSKEHQGWLNNMLSTFESHLWAYGGMTLRKCVRNISNVTGSHILWKYCDYIPDVTQMFPAVPSQIHIWLHSKRNHTASGGNIWGKLIQCPQCSQDVSTGSRGPCPQCHWIHFTLWKTH